MPDLRLRYKLHRGSNKRTSTFRHIERLFINLYLSLPIFFFFFLISLCAPITSYLSASKKYNANRRLPIFSLSILLKQSLNSPFYPIAEDTLHLRYSPIENLPYFPSPRSSSNVSSRKLRDANDRVRKMQWKMKSYALSIRNDTDR